jgi:hypothetical protein
MAKSRDNRTREQKKKKKPKKAAVPNTPQMAPPLTLKRPLGPGPGPGPGPASL